MLAQPLFDAEGGKTDRSLASFGGDYGRLCSIFERSLRPTGDRGAHDILILTGDIHTGRYAVATIAGEASADVHEFVASPGSRVGPFFMEAKPKPAPRSFTAVHEGSQRLWDVAEVEVSRSIDNNVGSVQVSPGTNGRWRFELELWRVRHHDSRSFWDRVRGDAKPRPALGRIYRREIQLR